MMTKPEGIDDSAGVTLRVLDRDPKARWTVEMVLAPNIQHLAAAPDHHRIDGTMTKAVARTFRWREMLEDGTHATITESAAAEKINQSYVCRILRLTLLAPDIVEAILNGRQRPKCSWTTYCAPTP